MKGFSELGEKQNAQDARRALADGTYVSPGAGGQSTLAISGTRSAVENTCGIPIGSGAWRLAAG